MLLCPIAPEEVRMRPRSGRRSRPTWLDNAPAEFPREPTRQPCGVGCELIVGGRASPAFLQDYTNRGFRVRCSERLLVGSDLELLIPNCGAVSATVRWFVGNEAGCAFKRAVKADLIRHAIEGASTH